MKRRSTSTKGRLTRIAVASLLVGKCCWAASTPKPAGFYPPAWGGGYQLLSSNNGYGEPLNIIISGLSSPKVLTDKGILNWARSVGFSYECAKQHGGGYFAANLGDGNEWKNQTAEFREMYGHAHVGTCLETFIGGNHFRWSVDDLDLDLCRVFRQDGPEANTGALFLAASKEEDLKDHHTVSPDGYDQGRDEIVEKAIAKPTKFDGTTYVTTSRNLKGLLPEGTQNINHGIAIDGVVKLLTIKITEEGGDDSDDDDDD
ncbi:uncharacterized protein FOMMEDRAFT_28873 [Fomitiporia mediterranea MF3/22]|uniref:uncharacterized protein n=1 Tax=Fomitiporia mediterranea (strain MF3/22) TaxID=694068 RepID=UPI00044088E8|nr:uncharacterized protein FOMMEDRAFT_28873 [Fomitiporia mediterranea MF3/22]EJD03375.1 hypothetical protein FOMMEDRAFT_28873 [Fomitiporia mediterranea MF3/22]